MEIFHILQKIKDQYTKFTNLEKKIRTAFSDYLGLKTNTYTCSQKKSETKQSNTTKPLSNNSWIKIKL